MIELCPELRDYFKGADAFDEVLNLDGKVYRLHKNRRTLRIERNGKGYFVKIHRRIGWGEVLKNIFSRKWPVLSARNEYRAIKKLETLGIDIEEPGGGDYRSHRPLTKSRHQSLLNAECNRPTEGARRRQGCIRIDLPD